jgi:hypothetical protein
MRAVVCYLHCGYVFSWEGVSGVGDEHAGFAHGAVPDHHTLDGPRVKLSHPATTHER